MSFSTMHDDYLDPDKHLWPDEPDCETCGYWDQDNGSCEYPEEGVCNWEEIKNG